MTTHPLRTQHADDPWDVVIIGGGPAGAAAALAARATNPQLRVLIVDRDHFPRDKCCGDGIAPHVFEELSSVGVAGLSAGWAPLTKLELANGDESVEGEMRRAVWVIPRRVFDARLLERAVDAGAILRREHIRSIERSPAGLMILNRTISTRVLVGADGAQSIVRGHLGLRSGRRAIAIRGYAPTRPGREHTQVIRYGGRRQPSYAWAFDRGDGWSNVGYGELLTRHKPSRQRLMSQLDTLLPDVSEGGTDWRAHHLPLSSWHWRHPQGCVLLAGDAAGLVHPMTGEGILYAVITGLAAGRSAATALRNRTPQQAATVYSAAVRARLSRHLRHTWAAARLAEAPHVVTRGIRAARADPEIFDDLVELGLGDARITPRMLLALVRTPTPSVGGVRR